MVLMSPTTADGHAARPRRRVALPRGGVPGPAVRRPLRPRRHVDGDLLPAVVPGADAQARERPLLRAAGRGGGCGVPRLPPVSSRPGVRAAAHRRRDGLGRPRTHPDRPGRGRRRRASRVWPARLSVSERHLHRLLVSSVGTGALGLAQARRAQTARTLLEQTAAAGHRRRVRVRFRQPATVQRRDARRVRGEPDRAAPASDQAGPSGRRRIVGAAAARDRARGTGSGCWHSWVRVRWQAWSRTTDRRYVRTLATPSRTGAARTASAGEDAVHVQVDGVRSRGDRSGDGGRAPALRPRRRHRGDRVGAVGGPGDARRWCVLGQGCGSPVLSTAGRSWCARSWGSRSRSLRRGRCWGGSSSGAGRRPWVSRTPAMALGCVSSRRRRRWPRPTSTGSG